MRVACVGVGNVGRSWATVFARAGAEVRLWDADPQAVPRALPLIAEALDAVGAPPEAIGRVRAAHSLEAALDGVDYAQESAAERVEVKAALFSQMDRAAPAGAILASSTSAIPGSAFLERVPGRGRCLVAHPVNPPHLIPLVELCPSPWTEAASVDRAFAFMTEIGQSPVRLAREIDGFLLNRLQWALMGEAFHLVGEGYCSPDDIDRVLTEGLALRWAFLGPFAVAHLNASAGVEGYFAVLKDAIARVQNDLRTAYPPDPDRVVAPAHEAQAASRPVERIAAFQMWRDRRIQALRDHLRTAEPAPGPGLTR